MMEKTIDEAQKKAYEIETTASKTQLASRDELQDLFLKSPLPTEDLLFNLGMYVRSSLLVKFLVMHDLYSRISHLPGAIVEFGTWWGQNLILLENLRAIHEPFNKQRTILGFDTFSGYTNITEHDKRSDVWKENSYSTSKNYKSYLQKLLEVHEGGNILGHVRNVHQLIEGDVAETAPCYFKEHPETVVALAYFDMGIYKPTKAAMEAIKPTLLPGSVILLDEFTWPESPGEAIAFKEVFGDVPFVIEKSKYYPSKAIVTIKGKLT
jgi:hypothetical protein